jgi:hypothetical protein
MARSGEGFFTHGALKRLRSSGFFHRPKIGKVYKETCFLLEKIFDISFREQAY